MQENTHYELWQSETRVSDSERAWSRYYDAAAKVLGLVSLDGDQETDGYSTDTAYDYWEQGRSVGEFVEFVRGEQLRLGK